MNNKEDFEAFKREWEGYPSQDNEGYVPDRGGFKCGWFAALEWERNNTKSQLASRDKEIERLRNKWHEHTEYIAVVLAEEEIESLKSKLAESRKEFEDYKNSPCHCDNCKNPHPAIAEKEWIVSALLKEFEVLRGQLAECEAKLKASEWLRKDNALRTYDGLTEKCERYREALDKISSIMCDESDSFVVMMRGIARNALNCNAPKPSPYEPKDSTPEEAGS